MIWTHLESEDIVDPAGLSLLGEVFNEVCQRRDIDATSEAAHSLAKQLLSLFNEGIRDREKLLTLIGEPGQDWFAETK